MTDKELFGSVLKGMGSLGARLFPFIFVFNSMLIVAGWSGGGRLLPADARRPNQIPSLRTVEVYGWAVGLSRGPLPPTATTLPKCWRS